MCGRYTLGREPNSLLDYFHLHGEVPTYHLSYNIAPTQTAPVIIGSSSQQRECRLMRWGLIPGWSKGPDPRFNMINAKAETIEHKPAYKNSFRHRRCLVPCDGFYEWHAVDNSGKKLVKGKQPYYIQRKDRTLLAMAGIWDIWSGSGQAADPEQSKSITSFSIITTDANPAMQKIHHRMPVILKPENFDSWLMSSGEQSTNVLKSLLIPYEDDDLMIYPVSTSVNSPKNNSAALIEPV